ncbi:MAG: hypothetical protein NT161_02070 [Candidatus Nomurabacteria bacterium]|nr:hypothetical protein [Candidatus Nomurabacteria bacterium]
MKKLVMLLVIIFSFTVKAQDSKFICYDGVSIKYQVSDICVIASDAEDITFLKSAIREELIRIGKVHLAGRCGDTLVVNLILQYNDGNKNNGRNGKWGEILLTVASNSGFVGATSRYYMANYDGGNYYKILQTLAEKVAKNFQYQ